MWSVRYVGTIEIHRSINLFSQNVLQLFNNYFIFRCVYISESFGVYTCAAVAGCRKRALN